MARCHNCAALYACCKAWPGIGMQRALRMFTKSAHGVCHKQARQARAIGGVGEGLVEGGDALAQGFVRGFTGLVTKPLAGARTGVGGAACSGSPLLCA